MVGIAQQQKIGDQRFITHMFMVRRIACDLIVNPVTGRKVLQAEMIHLCMLVFMAILDGTKTILAPE